MKIDKEIIKNYLPHRDPFLFVDGVDNLEEGKKIQTHLELKNELPFFKGHFPKKLLCQECLSLKHSHKHLA